MNKKLEDAFNQHINMELFSEYLYMSMANYFAERNLNGMAHWMRLQAAEERGHANKFMRFVHDRAGKVNLLALEQPRTEWSGPLEVFEDAYAHECKISGKIHDLVDLAQAEKDHAAFHFLQWFVGEQVEEEATALEIVDRLKLVGDSPVACLILDSKLGERAAQGG